ncbi:hypothetical protein [Kutzneria sp. CA-103260]|uniref:hypothetical protein n=1 Tax=Kutzneria sp. CA-103260 TaxID=2802641 RepID=UPI001BAD7728|nr:hypothetical protein [Kutzneria sp. CA-103260]QUQ71293.1 hypothetical protein JJ691_90780 [Kutzneria sp. CA-103260]
MADSADPFDFGPSDFGIRIASDEVLTRRDELADRVCAELRRAGLPARRHSADDEQVAGAEVAVDRAEETDGGGVFVQWCPDQSLVRAALGLPVGDVDEQALNAAAMTLPHRANDPSLIHSGAVKRHMQAAIIGILCSAGLRAYDPENEYGPYLVQVDVR